MEGAVDLSRFECRMCGACCRIPDGIVRLSDAEISRIAGHLGMSEADFIANETALSPDRRCLVLKDGADGACAMLDENGLCRIHAVKPDKCRTFPYEWTNANSAEYCEDLRRIGSSL